ncbi:MAG: hypothetical protein ABW167_13225 [Baekduia sp.]
MAGSPTLEFTVEPDDLLVIDDSLTERDFEDLLAVSVGSVDTLVVDSEDAPSLAEAMPWIPALLEEGVVAYVKAKFDEAKHPRWPKGTPRAGEFMQIGQRFDSNGKTYEVSAFTGGKVVAHLATGSHTETHELVLDKAEAEKAVKAPTQVQIASDKSKSKSVAGSVTIDPSVDSASHDPSIKKPDSLGLTDEQWKRFGALDQQHAIDLEERFGKWSPGKSKKLISELQHQYDSSIQQVISSALSSQYGSSSGNTLSLAGLVGGAPSPASIKKYETAKLLLRDTAEAIQWDLYHRTKGPDVAMFHWGGGNPEAKRKAHVEGKLPVLSAYSWSTGAFATTGFGSTLTAVPMAIRHVEMHTHSGGVYTSFAGEYEVTTGARLRLDDNSFFTSLSTVPSDVKKYLEKMAPKGGEPASGAILLEAAKAVKDPSYELPLPAEPPGLTTMPTAGGTKAYTELPLDIAKKVGEAAMKASYSGGSKESAIGVLSELGVKPGDFIEGLKGTRYVVIADPSDETSNLRYVKVEPNTKLPNYSKSYPFSASGTNNFYRLDGHVEVPAPEKQKGFEGISAEEMAALKPSGPKKKLAAFSAGGKFVLDGEAYEVGAPHVSGKIEVTSLSTGTKYLVNSGWKTSPVLPDANFTPEPDVSAKTWKAGDRVLVTAPGVEGGFVAHVIEPVIGGADGEKITVQWDGAPLEIPKANISEAPTLPGETDYEVGDKFAFEGGTYTVTSILKDGTVRAKIPGGNVQKFSKDVMGAAIVYRPSTFAVGNTAKVGDLDIGDTVQGGAGAKIKPYVIVAKLDGKVHLQNLETGETVKVTKNKSYKRLLDAPAIAQQGEVTKPGEHKGPAKLAGGWAKTGEAKLVKDLAVGDAIKISNSYWELTAKNDDGSYSFEAHSTDSVWAGPQTMDKDVVENSATPKNIYGPATPVQQTAKPELKGTFNDADWEEGPKAKLKDLPAGTVFVSATGLKMQLKSTSPKGGATATALHNGKTVKNISYDKDYTTLVEKPAAEPEPDLKPKVKAATQFGFVTVDGLPQHPDYDTYLHPKSGKFKYPKLSEMPAGTVFTDKAGNAYKIHQSNGGAVAVSDGQKIWKADPGWRGKLDDAGKVAFLDDPKTAAPHADAGEVTVGHLKAGDKFVVPAGYSGAGKEYEVVDTTLIKHASAQIFPDDPPTYTTIKVKPTSGDADTDEIATTLVPASVTPAKPDGGINLIPIEDDDEDEPGPPPGPAPKIGEHAGLPDGFVVNTTTFKDLPVGTYYAVDLGTTSIVAQITGQTTGGGIEVKTPYGTSVADPGASPDYVGGVASGA